MTAWAMWLRSAIWFLCWFQLDSLTHSRICLLLIHSSASGGGLVVNWSDRGNWATHFLLSNKLAYACLPARTQASRGLQSKAGNIQNITSIRSLGQTKSQEKLRFRPLRNRFYLLMEDAVKYFSHVCNLSQLF